MGENESGQGAGGTDCGGGGGECSTPDGGGGVGGDGESREGGGGGGVGDNDLMGAGMEEPSELNNSIDGYAFFKTSFALTFSRNRNEAVIEILAYF